MTQPLNVGLDSASMSNLRDQYISSEKGNMRDRYQLIGSVLGITAGLVTAVALTALMGYACYSLIPSIARIAGRFKREFAIECLANLFLYQVVMAGYIGFSIVELSTIAFDKLGEYCAKRFENAEKLNPLPMTKGPLNKEDIRDLLKKPSKLNDMYLEKLSFEQISLAKDILSEKEFTRLVSKFSSSGYALWQKILQLKGKSKVEVAKFFTSNKDLLDDPKSGFLLRKAVGEAIAPNANFYVGPLADAPTSKEMVCLKINETSVSVNKELFLKSSQTMQDYFNDLQTSASDTSTELNISLDVTEDAIKTFFSLINGDATAIQLDEKKSRELFLLADYFAVEKLVVLFYTFPSLNRHFDSAPPFSGADILIPIQHKREFDSFLNWRKTTIRSARSESETYDEFKLTAAFREASRYQMVMA